MKNLLLIFLIPLTGCVSMGKTEQYIGMNPETNKGIFEVVTTHTERGFFSPSITSIQVWNCESVVTDSGLKYQECLPVGNRQAFAQSGMGTAVTTTAIAGTAAYFTAGALRPDEYNHSETNNLNNEGSQQNQGQKGYMKGGDQNSYMKGGNASGGHSYAKGGDADSYSKGGKSVSYSKGGNGGHSHSNSYNRNSSININGMMGNMD